MKQHPHAEVLLAIADGVPLSEFEIKWEGSDWKNLGDGTKWSSWIFDQREWSLRRKPQHIMVNGFKVPKPLDCLVAPNSLGTVYWPYLTHGSLWDSALPSNSEAKLAIQRGCAHTTKENAIAHAKAMLGIDPEAS